MKEYNEASRLADDISSMIADRGSLPQSGPEIMRHTSAIRRKITILGTRLDSLESLLGRIPPKSMYARIHKYVPLAGIINKVNNACSVFFLSIYMVNWDLQLLMIKLGQAPMLVLA